MIVITDKVSNAIAKYYSAFGYRIKIGDIPNTYTTADMFVTDVTRMIENNLPEFGGERREDGTEI